MDSHSKRKKQQQQQRSAERARAARVRDPVREKELARRLSEAALWLRHNGHEEAARSILDQHVTEEFPATPMPLQLPTVVRVEQPEPGENTEVEPAETATAPEPAPIIEEEISSPGVVLPTPAPMPMRGRHLRLLAPALAGVLLCLSVGAVYAVARPSRKDSKATAPITHAKAPAPPSPATVVLPPVAPAQAEAEPAPVPDDVLEPLSGSTPVESNGSAPAPERRTGFVRWSFDSTPRGARVVREDTQLALGKTPFALTFRTSPVQVPLRFELKGFVPVQRMARLDASIDLNVELVPVTDKPKEVAQAKPSEPSRAEEPVAKQAEPAANAGPAPLAESATPVAGGAPAVVAVAEAEAPKAANEPKPAAPAHAVPARAAPSLDCPAGTHVAGAAPPRGLKLWCETERGVMQGKFVRYFADGAKAEEGEFRDGKKHGRWTEYYEVGGERERTEWRKGVKAW